MKHMIKFDYFLRTTHTFILYFYFIPAKIHKEVWLYNLAKCDVVSLDDYWSSHPRTIVIILK